MVTALGQPSSTACAPTIERALLISLVVLCLGAPADAGQSLAGAQSLGGTQLPGTQPPTPAEQTPPPVQTPQIETASPFNIAPPGRAERPYRGLFGSSRPGLVPRLVLESMFGGGLGSNPGANQVAGGPTGGAAGGDGAFTGMATLSYDVSRKTWGIYANNVVTTDFYPDVSENKLLSRDFATLSMYFVPWALDPCDGHRSLQDAAGILVIGLVRRWIQSRHSDRSRLRAHREPLQPVRDHGRRHPPSVKTFGGYRECQLRSRHQHRRPRVDHLRLFRNLQLQHQQRSRPVCGISRRLQKDLGERSSKSSERRPMLNFGVDYNKALSFSRRTKVTFSTGTAGIEDRITGQVTYNMIGGVGLSREFGRTWNAGVFYSRDVRYVEQLSVDLSRHWVRHCWPTLLSTGRWRIAQPPRRAQRVFQRDDRTSRLSGRQCLRYLFCERPTLSRSVETLRRGGRLRLHQADDPRWDVGLRSCANLHSARAYLKVWAPLISAAKRP